jgi:hypothetical protein
MDYDAPLWSALRYIEQRYNVILSAWGVDDVAYKILELKDWDEEQMPTARAMAQTMWTDEFKGTLSDQLNHTTAIDDVVGEGLRTMELDNLGKLW